MNTLSFGILLFTAWCAVRLCAHCAEGVWRRPAAWIAALAAAVLLLRPHGDTFTALDHSGYRLMAYAFSEGRAANGVDRTLLELPPEVRQDCTLLPRTEERNTRDRSFLLKSDQTGETEPFFYPVLPMGAAALQKIWPWGGMDLFVPLIGLAFAWALLAVGFRSGGIAGLCLAAALFLGTPLPAMLLRGFYAEVCGAALLALAALHWLVLPKGKPVSLAAYAALGLAPAFHPVLIVVSLPLLAALVASGRESSRRWLAGLLLFASGLALLAWVTARICAPYGSIRWENLAFNFRANQSHQVADVFMLGFGLAFAGLLFWRLLHPASFASGLARLRPGARGWLAAGLVPLALALLAWRESPRVRTGLLDLWSGVGVPFAAVVAAAALVLILSVAAGRARFVAGVSLAVLPVFAYLKGAEQMGMWSERRLAPFVLLLIPALLVPAARWTGTRWGNKPWASAGIGLLVLILGGANLCRWPAPYGVRQESGALARVAALKDRIGNRFALFDYLPDSFPFAVDGQTRAAGWSSRAQAGSWDMLMSWLQRQAGTEEVWCVSSYSSPGLEAGVRLVPLFTEKIPVVRVHSKQALPALRRESERKLEFLRVEPAGDGPLGLFKTMDGGPLALRGNWGPVRPMAYPDGRSVQGQWTREGSGIVGPVPRTGRVRMAWSAASGQRGKTQRVKIIPPWGEEQAAWVDVAPDLAEHEVWFSAPAGAFSNRTGVYRFHAAEPYDPARDGQGDYPADLGVLIHDVRMDEVE